MGRVVRVVRVGREGREGSDRVTSLCCKVIMILFTIIFISMNLAGDNIYIHYSISL